MQNLMKHPRARTLLGVGAAIVTLASCGGEAEKKGFRSISGDPFLDGTVIAEVGDYQITAAELEHRLQFQFEAFAGDYSAAGEKSIRDILRTDIDRLCLVTEAERTGYTDSSKVYRVMVEGARRKVLQGQFITDVVTPRAAPTEDDLRKVYESNFRAYSSPRRRAVRHILVNTKAEAEAALARVEAGEEFGDVVRDVSLDTISHDGAGAIGWVQGENEVRNLGLVPRFSDRVLRMELNETKVVESSKGWHVVRVMRADDEAVRPFEEVRDQLYERELRRRSQVELEEFVRDLRRKYGARLHDEALTAFLAWRRSVPEKQVFARAENEPDPQERLKIYEEFLEKFPQSDKVCEAKFLRAFTYADEIKGDRNRSRILLNEFIKSCPESDLVESAQFMLDGLTRAK
jgi:hypothetical protein